VTAASRILKLLLKPVPPYRRNIFANYWRKIYSKKIALEFQSCGCNLQVNGTLYLRCPECISLGNDISIGRRNKLTAWAQYNNQEFSPIIKLGDRTRIGDDCHITAIQRIQFGADVLLGNQVTITDNAHGNSSRETLEQAPLSRPLFSKGDVIIGDRVWIGDKATILPGVNIGKGSIIGANTVVTHNVPEYSIAIGSPMKIIPRILPAC
jgi:acetyltransferase-like isoleucine patch superfamily enzyme